MFLMWFEKLREDLLKMSDEELGRVEREVLDQLSGLTESAPEQARFNNSSQDSSKPHDSPVDLKRYDAIKMLMEYLEAVWDEKFEREDRCMVKRLSFYRAFDAVPLSVNGR